MQEELKNYDKTLAKNHFKHTKRLENKYWEEDGILEETHTSPIIITEEDEDSGDEDSDQEDCIARATTVVMENGDQVDHGGDLSLWDCDWAYDIFERELEIGNYMVDTTATRGRGRGRRGRCRQCPL
ncbi:uncharacterized protein LOC110862799 [Folsomia candida]|nr:uncharacterized protein LOC110862799 [Folsomia candida]